MLNDKPEIPPQSAIVENANGSILRLSPEIERDVASRVKADYDSSDSERRTWLQKKKKGLELYYGLLADKTFPFKNCANLNVPLLRTLKETLHANVHQSFDDKTPIDVLPVGPEDMTKASRIKKFMNWQFINEIRFSTILDPIIDFCLTYGHATVKMRYVKETRKRKVPKQNRAEDIMAQTAGGVEEQDEVIFDGVKVDVINPEDVMFPPGSITAEVDELDYIIHEIPMTISDIRMRQASGYYKNIEIKDPKDTGKNNRMDQELKDIREKYIGILESKSGIKSNQAGPKTVRVIEWYGFYDVDKDGIEEKVMVTMLLESKEILRMVLWDMSRPFQIVRFSPIFNTPFGESVADLIGKINEELNTLHNQRVDSVTLSNIPYGFYDPMSGFDPEKVELTPGLMLPTNGNPSSAVYFPPMQPVRPEMYREEELLIAYAEKLVGAGANTQGVVNQRRTSATEISTADRRAGIRFFLIFKRIQEGVEGIARKVLELNQRLMPPYKQVRVMGASDWPLFVSQVSFDKFTREEMQGKYDLVAVGQSVMDEQANKQDQMTIYQLAMTNPLVMSDPESMYEVTKDTLQALGAKNLGAYIKKPIFASPQDPELENNRMAQGERVEPVRGEDIERHLMTHAEFINSPQFQMVPPEGQLQTIKHFQQTLRLKFLMQQQMQLQAQMAQTQQNDMMGNMMQMQEQESNLRMRENDAKEQSKAKHGKRKD